MHGEIGRTQKMINIACDKWLKDKGHLQSRGIGFLFNREQLIAKNKAKAKPKAPPKPRQLKPPMTQEEKRIQWRDHKRNSRAKEKNEAAKV